MGLLLWTAEAPLPYGLDVEVAAVWRALDERGWTEVDLVGFSAGATVVLAAALAQRDRVRTLVLIEPATVGDDLWSEDEAAFSAALADLRRLPVADRPAAFARLASPQDEPSLGPLGEWDVRTDLLEDALADPGFGSSDLAVLKQPTLVISGGRSAARFMDVAHRLISVMPGAEQVVIPSLTHMRVRDGLDEVTDAIREFWAGSL